MPKLRIFRSSRTNEARNPAGQKSRTSSTPRILFVSHEATRTGAPKIILNLLKHFHSHCHITCETILHEDGQLLEEFQCFSATHSLYLPRQRSGELQKKVRNIVNQRRKPQPLIALCNSMESRFVADVLQKEGIPVVQLVHELPGSYSDADYRMVYDLAAKIVFPVQAVRDATNRKLTLPLGKDLILPQGLLDPNFGKGIGREAAYRQIRDEFSLPSDAFIVLGCGTLDLRKGIDHFAQVAIRSLKRNRSNRPIHFVWMGDGPRWAHSAYHYVQIDLKNTQTVGNVHFIGEREHVEPYFVGADMFLLSSRVDPFPCVIHEAMASSLPVMTFDSSGGAGQAIADGGGFLVPYADHEMAAGIICSIAMNPAMANSMREKSLQRVATDYRFEMYGDNMIALAESLTASVLRRPDLRLHSESKAA